MNKLPGDDDADQPTDESGTARAEDAGEGVPSRGRNGTDEAEDHRVVLWAIDETAKLHGHLESRNRELHALVQRVGVADSLKDRIAIRALNRRGCKLIERISHFELIGVIIG